MKKIFVLIAVAFLFISCSGNQNTPLSENNTENTTNTDALAQDNTNNESSEASSMMSLDEVFSSVDSKFSENENFKMCVANNVDLCISEQSYDDSGVSVVCEDYVLENNRAMCEQNEALANAREQGDVSLCEGLQDTESCEFEVLLEQGRESGDVSVCEEVSESYKTQCNNEIINTLARDSLDASVCDDIISYDESEFEKQFCIEEVNFLKEEEERRAELESEIGDETEANSGSLNTGNESE